MCKYFSNKHLNQIADEVPTPFYVFSPEKFKQNIQSLKQAFLDEYTNFKICYAAKTNFLPDVIKCASEAGAAIEIVPGIESDVLSKAGLWNKDIVVNGPLKRTSELSKAIEEGASINVDNITELELLNGLAKEQNKTVSCGIRVKQNDELEDWSRFGFSIEAGDAEKVLRKIQKDFKNLRVNSIHMHMGTNNNDLASYSSSVKNIANWCAKMGEASLLKLEILNVGGGYSSDCPLKPKEDGWTNPSNKQLAEAICRPLKSALGDLRPMLVIEPGRRLVDDCFVFLSTASRFIDIDKTQLILDSTYSMFPSYGHRAHKVAVLNKEAEVAIKRYDIFGGSPIHFDCIRKSYKLPPIDLGDILIIHNAGAYSINMSSNFSRYLPNIVKLGKTGSFEIIQSARSYEALFE